MIMRLRLRISPPRLLMQIWFSALSKATKPSLTIPRKLVPCLVSMFVRWVDILPLVDFPLGPRPFALTELRVSVDVRFFLMLHPAVPGRIPLFPSNLSHSLLFCYSLSGGP